MGDSCSLLGLVQRLALMPELCGHSVWNQVDIWLILLDEARATVKHLLERIRTRGCSLVHKHVVSVRHARCRGLHAILFHGIVVCRLVDFIILA